MFTTFFIMMKTFFAYVIKFLSLKNLLRIIFLYLTGLILRFVLVKYCNVDVFYDYTSLYSNLYYLLMAILSVVTLEISNFIPNWTYIFECVKIFTKHYLKGKMVPMGPSSGSYGDISLIGRKNVYSMDNSSNNNSDSNRDSSGSNTSRSRSPPDGVFPFDGTETEIEKVNARIERLEFRISIFDRNIRFFNDPETRSIARQLDINALDDDNYIPLTREERNRWHRVIRLRRNRVSFDFTRRIYGNNAALDGEINRQMNSIRRAYDKMDQYRQRIQIITAETQSSQISQSQGTNANNTNNNN